MLESLRDLMLVCFLLLLANVQDACAKFPSLSVSTPRESAVIPGGPIYSSDLTPCSQSSATWNAPFFQFIPLKAKPGDSCFRTPEMITRPHPAQRHQDLSEHMTSGNEFFHSSLVSRDSPGALSMTVGKDSALLSAYQGSATPPDSMTQVLPELIIDEHLHNKFETRKFHEVDIQDATRGPQVGSKRSHLHADTKTTDSKRRELVRQAINLQTEPLLQGGKPNTWSIDLDGSESTPHETPFMKRNYKWNEDWNNFDMLPSSSKRNFMKTYIFEHLDFDVEDKEFTEWSHRIHIKRRGHTLKYGPFYAFTSAMEGVKTFGTPVREEIYLIYLQDFLAKYLSFYCKTFLKRRGQEREMYIEQRILAELYIQSGIIEAHNISLWEVITEFFSNEEKKTLESSVHVCNKQISRVIEHSKDATVIFLQHIRSTYELVNGRCTKERLEEEITSLQKAGLNYALKLWENLDYKEPPASCGKKDFKAESNFYRSQLQNASRIFSHDSCCKRGKAARKISWSWELLKMFYEAQQEALADILFKSPAIKRSLEAFVKHCTISEFLKGNTSTSHTKGASKLPS